VEKTCRIATWGVVRVPWEEIARLRRNPGPAEGLPNLPQLKLADEQTVLAMAAVLQACQRAGLAPTSFRDWSILGAPKYMGRPRLAQAIHRFQKQGVRAVSPLVIPMLSQHSVAGTLSLLLGCHGPTFGVGACTSSPADALLNGLCLLDRCPGVWAVMTAYDPEPVPDGAGQVVTPTTGIGVAMALTPSEPKGSRWQAEHGRGAIRLVIPTDFQSDCPALPSLVALADTLEQANRQSSWRFPLRGGGYVEVTPSTNSAALRQAG
jgi:hypothetical protein